MVQIVNFQEKGYKKLSLHRRDDRCKQLEITQSI